MRHTIFLLLLLLPLALAGSAGAITTCTANWQGGVCVGNIAYTVSTTLTNNINATGSILIDSGITLNTNNYNIWIGGTFSNKGTIITGNTVSQSAPGSPNSSQIYTPGKTGCFFSAASTPSHYGLYIQASSINNTGIINASGFPGLNSVYNNCGAGGGSGGSVVILAYNGTLAQGTIYVNGGTGGVINSGSAIGPWQNPGGAGGSTITAGGAGGTYDTNNSAGGSSPTAPALSNSEIQTMYSNGFQNYLTGGQGGGGGLNHGPPDGGYPGATGLSYTNSYGGSGGGGTGTSLNVNMVAGAGGAGVVLA